MVVCLQCNLHIVTLSVMAGGLLLVIYAKGNPSGGGVNAGNLGKAKYNEKAFMVMK